MNLLMCQFIVKHTDIYPPNVKFWGEAHPETYKNLNEQCILLGALEYIISHRTLSDESIEFVSTQYWKSEANYKKAAEFLINTSDIKVRNLYFKQFGIKRHTEYENKNAKNT